MKKLGSQLRTGDIITRMPGNEHGPGLAVRLLVVNTIEKKTSEHDVAVVDLQEAPRLRIGIRYFRPNETYEVAAPEPLLDAQELSWLVTAGRYFVEQGIAHPERLPILLDRLDPPKPPTLDEVLAALDHVMRATGRDRVDPADVNHGWTVQILDRARRAGLLPKGDAS